MATAIANDHHVSLVVYTLLIIFGVLTFADSAAGKGAERQECSIDERLNRPCLCCKMDCWYGMTEQYEDLPGFIPIDSNADRLKKRETSDPDPDPNPATDPERKTEQKKTMDVLVEIMGCIQQICSPLCGRLPGGPPFFGQPIKKMWTHFQIRGSSIFRATNQKNVNAFRFIFKFIYVQYEMKVSVW